MVERYDWGLAGAANASRRVAQVTNAVSWPSARNYAHERCLSLELADQRSIVRRTAVKGSLSLSSSCGRTSL